MTTRNKQLVAEHQVRTLQRELANQTPADRVETINHIVQLLTEWCDEVEAELAEEQWQAA